MHIEDLERIGIKKPESNNFRILCVFLLLVFIGWVVKR